MAADGREVTAITIERGWKLNTMLAKYGTGFKCFAFAPKDPYDFVDMTIAYGHDAGDLIQKVIIIGHGNASGIQIGGHFVELSNFKDYEGHFAKIREVISGESFVYLRGCTVGQNERLLASFARAFGVPTYAGTSAENVLWDFNFGDIMVAYPGGSVSKASRP
ncbi:DUF4347 domain-containing protein [Kumtagia ephedrae]|jgi:hypothetical protein|uniref:DUF4347 domain-containing protein n=1 Tax=Kumtagia ephedrae TaxID=2116701 RepID=A0A2P7SDH7_9HYPH|nr:DUF4347 domain-containing protein [Mesorhizobium ephedrae]PSJ60566.1 hypothetical protein C7I84_11365 [Mesorhizobium ephedrae]